MYLNIRWKAPLLALLATALTGAAQATPAPADPLGALLVERGWAVNERAVARARHADVVLTALNFLDVNYQWGGVTAATGFDCSGFTRHVFGVGLGLALPRTTAEQAVASSVVEIDRADLRPGDLVFFNTRQHEFSHVGIYLGDDRFVHAPRSGAQVRVENMRQTYWAQRYTGARRALASE